MALTADIETFYVCPKCGATGASAFVFQTRVTIKQKDPIRKPELLDIYGSTPVYACANCGHVVKNA